MAFSWSIDGDHETGNTRKRPEGARPIWLLALGLPLRRSSEPPFRDTLYVRLATQIPTTFAEDIRPGEQRVGEGVVTDISLGGCYMQTFVQLSQGTLVSLELQTEQDTPAITVEAAIVRIVRPTGVGLEFLRLSEPEHERFSQFIRQLLVAQLPAEAEDG
jgi:PilZ domain